jgi:hypothetical protein
MFFFPAKRAQDVCRGEVASRILLVQDLLLARLKIKMRQQTYTCCAWAGGTFFPVVLLCQFCGFRREIGFGVTYLRI